MTTDVWTAPASTQKRPVAAGIHCANASPEIGRNNSVPSCQSTLVTSTSRKSTYLLSRG